MPSNPPKRVTDLPSPFVDPSPVTRDELAASPAHARARAYTARQADTQVPAIMARAVETAGQALVAALDRATDRWAALAAAVDAARAAGVPDEQIRARLVIAGLDQANIAAALA